MLDAGAVIFNAKCANCHGSQGNSNPTNLKPAPRNFHTDAWKNPNGGSPYALYLVLTKGLGTMPAFQSLTPEQRYAVNHYIVDVFARERAVADERPVRAAIGGLENAHPGQRG